MKKDTRTTVFVAVATFLGLTLLSVVAWSLTRPEQPVQAATMQPQVQPQAEPPQAEQHDHEHTFERISFDDFKKAVDANAVTVIDVRSMEQFLAGHIPGSLHIPLGRIEGEVPYLPKGKPVVTYCTCPAEESSGEAAMILANSGVSAKALTGGLDEWTKRGLPMKSGVE
jgi:rhodanese-related sulfurtransferase